MKTDKKIPKDIERIYNEHLATSRTFHNKPFKLRKNFDGFQDDERYKYYARLHNWFEKHPEINRKLYFESMLFFNRDIEIVNIKEYCKSRALTNYSQYLRIIKSLDLDNPKTLKMCADSFEFIYNFCFQHNISLSEYVTYKNSDNEYYVFLNHVKKADVLIYALFAFGNFASILKELYRDNEAWDFYIGDFTPLFLTTRFNNSEKFKPLTKLLLEKYNKKLANYDK